MQILCNIIYLKEIKGNKQKQKQKTGKMKDTAPQNNDYCLCKQIK